MLYLYLTAPPAVGHHLGNSRARGVSEVRSRENNLWRHRTNDLGVSR